MLSKLKDDTFFITTIIFVSILGCALVVYGMKWGPWAGSDSVTYLDTARNFASGDGLVQRQASGDRVPLTLHPPFYPIILASLNIFSKDIFLSAKILNVLLFGSFIFVIGFCIRYYTNHRAYSILICILFLSSPIFLSLFTGAMSEPLFFVISTVSLMFIIVFLDTNRTYLLVASAILAGLSLLTRYVGVSIIATGSLGLLILLSGRILTRLYKSVVYSAMALSPFFIWRIYLYYSGVKEGFIDFSRSDLWTRLSPYKIEFIENVWQWMRFDSLLPALEYDDKLNIFLIMIIAFLLVFVTAIVKSNRGFNIHRIVKIPSFQLTVIFLVFSFTYIVVSALAFLFSAQHEPFPNERLMSPILLGIILGCSSAALFVLDLYRNSRVLKVSLSAIFIGLFSLQIASSISYLQNLHEHGDGYTSKKWQSSDLMDEVKGLPEGIDLISNEAEAILLYANRPAYRIPELLQRKKYEPYITFGEDPEDEIQQIFRIEGAALVLFDSAYWQFNAFYFHRAADRLEALTRDLYHYRKNDDGDIYFYRTP